MRKEKQHQIDPNGFAIDLETGKTVGAMVAIHGSTRSTCRECGKPITAAKRGGWVHSDGRFMFHDPKPENK